MAVMELTASPKWRLSFMSNKCLSMLICSNASPRFSMNMRMGAWHLPNTESLTPLPSVKLIPAIKNHFLSCVCQAGNLT